MLGSAVAGASEAASVMVMAMIVTASVMAVDDTGEASLPLKTVSLGQLSVKRLSRRLWNGWGSL